MGVFEPPKTLMKTCIKSSGEKLSCGPFTGCCGDTCCPENLTPAYVFGGVIGIIVILCILLAIRWCYGYCRRRYTSYRRMIDLKPEPTQKKGQPFDVVVEKGETMLYPVGQTGPSNNDIASLLSHLNGPGKEEGNQFAARV